MTLPVAAVRVTGSGIPATERGSLVSAGESLPLAHQPESLQVTVEVKILEVK